MYKQLSFYTFFFIIVLFCVQCQSNNSTIDKEANKPTVLVDKPVEPAKANIEVKTSEPEQLDIVSKPKVVEEESPKVVEEPKKVAAKTTELADRKKEPATPKKKVRKKRPTMNFGEKTFKFGTIKQGDKIEHKFKFKNTGDAPLVIKTVDVSCGCTFPSYPFIPIEPGEEGIIEVTFDSAHKIGRQKPTVTVVSNARPRTVKLYLEGFVE